MLSLFPFVLSGPALADGVVHVTGTVTGQSGGGAQNVSVTATAPGGSTTLFGPVSTAADGSYELDVNSGTYDFHFEPQAGSGLSPVVHSDLTVDSDQILNVPLAPTTLSGTVKDRNNVAIPGASLSLHNPGGQTFTATTDATGAFSVQVNPVFYTVTISGTKAAAPAAFVPSNFTLNAGSVDLATSRSQAFTVSAVTLTVTTKSALTGDIVAGVSLGVSTTADTGLCPGAGASSGNGFTSATTDSSGVAAVVVLCGSGYGVDATPPAGSGVVATSFPLAGPVTEDTSDELDLTGDLGHLRGTVTFTDDTGGTGAIPGATVRLSGPLGTFAALTGSDGTYDVEAAAGSYSVTVTGGRFANTTLHVPDSFTLSAGSVTVPDTDTSLDVNLPTTTVTVDAQSGSGAPLPDVGIQITGASGQVTLAPGGAFTATATNSRTTGASGGVTVWVVSGLAYTTEATPVADSGYIVTNNPASAVVTAPTSWTIVLDRAPGGDAVNEFQALALTDTTPPTITYTAAPTPNVNGWNRANVTVTFTCSDPLSGIASCPAPVTLSTNGADQSVTGTATDNAGNTATITTAPINIDKVTPTITGTASGTPNAAGWRKFSSTVSFSCTDNLSGVHTCGPNVTLGEGANQSVTGTSVDFAGNSTSTTVSGINIDLTPPMISFVVTPSKNANGWRHSASTVTFNCTDNLSGIASCTSPVLLPDDGADQIVTGFAVDKAGRMNMAVVHVNIDSVRPTISGSLSGTPNAAGWYNTAPTVTFTCTDALSGIDTCTPPVTLGAGASQSVTGTAVDLAGNTASTTVSGVKVDLTPPTIHYTLTPAANATGWNNSAVTVAFTCADTLSGIASCPAPATVSAEGGNQTVTGMAVDNAGNIASSTAVINIDTTAPVISAAVTSSPNAEGWYNTPPIVHYTCSDALSGVATCPPDQTITSNGTNQTATGTAIDNAGNTASATVSGLNIDTTGPVLHLPADSTVAATSSAGVTVDYPTPTATDAVDGAVPVSCDHPSGTQLPIGVTTITCTATDSAGHTATASFTVTVQIAAPAPPTVTSVVPGNHSVTITWLKPPDGGSPILGYTVTASPGGQSCSTNSADDLTCTITGLTNGVDYTFTVTARNAVGTSPPPSSGGGTGGGGTGGTGGGGTGTGTPGTPPAPVGGVTPTPGLGGTEVTLHWLAAASDLPIIGYKATASPGGQFCTTDGALFCTITGLDPTTDYAFTVVAINGAGSSDPSPPVQLDTVAPTVTGTADRDPDTNGWYNGPVTITWTTTDPTPSSGTPTTPPATIVDTEGATQAITSASSCDPAGNCAPGHFGPINIDTTPPTISAMVIGTKNAAGWYNTAPTVHYTCTDALSGVATCPSDQTITTEGANQTTTGIVTDLAGNTASTTVDHLNIDLTPPTITVTVVGTKNAAGWYNAPPTVHYTCSDAVSGIATCPADQVVNVDGANQIITGTAADVAGNAVSAPVSVNVDLTAPTITPTVIGTKNSAGWYNAPPTIHYTCTDALSGIATCPADQTVSTEGADQAIIGMATDAAGNSASASVSVNVDLTVPTLGAPAWSANPKPITSSTVLTVPASDAVSGVAAGEYFLDTDHGPGNNTPMTVSGGNLTATIGTNLVAGVYQVGVRARDTAGNWSTPTYTMLVVYDPSITVGVTGKNKNDLVPSFTGGDVLPGLSSSAQTDTVDFGFTVDYTNGSLDPHNDFMLTYQTGTQCHTPHPQGCHSFTVAATGFDWMIIDQTNNSRGRFQGTATVTVDGVTTSNPFTVEGIDGDRLTPATDDHFTFKVFTPGANPTTATPIYQVSGSLAKGNSIKIR